MRMIRFLQVSFDLIPSDTDLEYHFVENLLVKSRLLEEETLWAKRVRLAEPAT
jgi:hypothetical protein